MKKQKLGIIPSVIIAYIDIRINRVWYFWRYINANGISIEKYSYEWSVDTVYKETAKTLVHNSVTIFSMDSIFKKTRFICWHTEPVVAYWRPSQSIFQHGEELVTGSSLPVWGDSDRCWLLRKGESVYFKGVVPSRLTFQWMA